MVEKYTQEQFWKLYQKLPQALKEALSAEETGNSIDEVCRRNGILEKLDQMVKLVGSVLVGLLPPDEFQEVLEKELKLEASLAKKVNQEITRFIFYPVRTALEELYQKEFIPTARPTSIPPPPEEKPKAMPEGDIYREPIE